MNRLLRLPLHLAPLLLLACVGGGTGGDDNKGDTDDGTGESEDSEDSDGTEDSEDSEAEGDTEDTEDIEDGGLQGSADFADPTVITLDVTGSGSVLAGFDAGSTHFWSFTPATAGDYTVTVTGPEFMSATWCGNDGTATGCLCNVGGEGGDPCCTIFGAATMCTAYMIGLSAGDDGILTVFHQGGTEAEYTVSISATP